MPALPELLELDLVIIGAGPAGLVLAAELGGSGLSIGLLESGRGQGSDLDLNRGETAGYPYARLEHVRARGLGGTSQLWHELDRGTWPVNDGMRSRRLDPIDFEPAPGLRQPWPITWEELAPFYARAEARFGLGPPPEAPPAAAPDPGHVETAVCQFAPAAAIERLVSAVRNSAVRVFAGMTVLELETDPSGRSVVAAVAVSAQGRPMRFLGRRFVLACGGIENARLLLLSHDRQAEGLGNAGGHVGRWFMEHLHVDAGHLWPASPDWQQQLGFYRRHVGPGGAMIGALRVADAVQREERLLNSLVGLAPRDSRLTPRSVRMTAQLSWGVQARSMPSGWPSQLGAALARPDEVGRALVVRSLGRTRGDAAALVVTSEQAPNPRSRVTLGRKRDRYGRPLPRLEWHLSRSDERTVRRSADIVGAAMERAGVGRFQSQMGDGEGFPRFHGCWHHIGTTRMSDDPRDGVVDADCRVHGTENLFAAGSSVMPSAGATTVTLTIAALAVRLADHLRGSGPSGDSEPTERGEHERGA